MGRGVALEGAATVVRSEEDRGRRMPGSALEIRRAWLAICLAWDFHGSQSPGIGTACAINPVPVGTARAVNPVGEGAVLSLSPWRLAPQAVGHKLEMLHTGAMPESIWSGGLSPAAEDDAGMVLHGSPWDWRQWCRSST
jgi:hypothetical protein